MQAKAASTEIKGEIATQGGAAAMQIVNTTNSKANATGLNGVFFSSVPQMQQKPFQVKVPAVQNKVRAAAGHPAGSPAYASP